MRAVKCATPGFDVKERQGRQGTPRNAKDAKDAKDPDLFLGALQAS